MIPLSTPRIAGNAWKYLKDCLDTGWVSSVGSYVRRFESELAQKTGRRHAVAAVNGTCAIHAALLSSGVGPGDGVFVPAMTFIATANAVAHCGAAPVFIDCEPLRFNMDPDALEDFIERRCVRRKGGLFTRREGLRMKVLLPAHILGYPADMRRLGALARRWGLLLIEDAAESIGSTLSGRHTGAFGAAGCLSFNGNKLVTCGGGGMIVTDDARLARRIRHVTQQAKTSPKEYFHDEVGYNYRLTNLSAALGLSQMELLPEFLRKRDKIAGWYRKGLSSVPAEPIPKEVLWNRWLMSVQTSSRKEKTRLLNLLSSAACEARPLWAPIPLQKPYRDCPRTPFPNARHAYDTVVEVPSDTSLTESQVKRVVSVLKKAELTRLLA